MDTAFSLPLPPLASDARSATITGAIAEYGSRLARFVRGKVASEADAEDIVQEVWYQLGAQPEVEMIESMSGWLFRVARNKITDAFRKRKPLPAGDLAASHADEDEPGPILASLLPTDPITPEDTLLRDMLWEQIMAAVDALPVAQREAFVLNELDGLTLQQIADAQGVPLKTVISRKGYAVRKLRERLASVYAELGQD